MDLKVLGCHGGETPKHRTSSFLVDDRLAIDAGAITSMLSLEEQQKIEAVLVSHAHMDHIRDLATIADNRCQQGGPPLEIVGIPATLRELKRHFFNDKIWPDFSKIQTKTGPTIVYRPVRPETTASVAQFTVQPILVDHTIEAAGFIIRNGQHAIAYSGDTGPTERFWEVLNETEGLSGLLMEVSFPNSHQQLADVSGHHTPRSVGVELGKLEGREDLPVFFYHIKPVFQGRVERELAQGRALKKRNVNVLRIGDRFALGR